MGNKKRAIRGGGNQAGRTRGGARFRGGAPIAALLRFLPMIINLIPSLMGGQEGGLLKSVFGGILGSSSKSQNEENNKMTKLLMQVQRLKRMKRKMKRRQRARFGRPRMRKWRMGRNRFNNRRAKILY